jgi:GntR family transcriptional repressor for pyruvate dehydrogenase complex
MNFPKVEKTSLTDRVAEILYEKIVNGEISPGERLPSEMELAEQLGVARPTVREALNRLIGLGLIKRGGYTMVVSENGSMSTRAGTHAAFLDQWEARELYEARYMIEVDLVVLAIQKATDEDIRELRNINEQLKSDCVSQKSTGKSICSSIPALRRFPVTM